MGCKASRNERGNMMNHNHNISRMAVHGRMYKLQFEDGDGKENYYEARCDKHRLKKQNAVRSLDVTPAQMKRRTIIGYGLRKTVLL